MNIYPDGQKDNANPIPINVDTVVKYIYGGDASNDYSQDISTDNATLSAITKPTFSGNTCDNFALEVHLKVLYTSNANSGFDVTRVNAVIVYGKYTGVDPVSIVRKTSLQFVARNETVSVTDPLT